MNAVMIILLLLLALFVLYQCGLITFDIKRSTVYIATHVAELEEALYDDERFAAREYTDYLDVDSFVDFWLVFELTMNSEPLHPCRFENGLILGRGI